jgi:hypothetical protein
MREKSLKVGSGIEKSGVGRAAAIDIETRAGDEAGIVREQIRDRRRDVAGRAGALQRASSLIRPRFLS